MHTILPVIGPVSQEYYELDKALSDQPLYHSLCLNDFTPLDNYSRRLWLTQLALPYPVKEYRYAYGNQLGVFSFLWRISDPEDESSLAKVLFTIEKTAEGIFYSGNATSIHIQVWSLEKFI